MKQTPAAQTNDELVGLLTAISIVSRRLAENLKKLPKAKGGRHR